MFSQLKSPRVHFTKHMTEILRFLIPYYTLRKHSSQKYPINPCINALLTHDVCFIVHTLVLSNNSDTFRKNLCKGNSSYYNIVLNRQITFQNSHYSLCLAIKSAKALLAVIIHKTQRTYQVQTSNLWELCNVKKAKDKQSITKRYFKVKNNCSAPQGFFTLL